LATPKTTTCSKSKLVARVVVVETSLKAFKKLMKERQVRANKTTAFSERAIAAALASVDKSQAKADAAMEKRFEGVNEFRGVLADQSMRMLPRVEYEATHKSLTEKIDAVASTVTKVDAATTTALARIDATSTGKSAQSMTNYYTVTGAAIVISVLISIGTLIYTGLSRPTVTPDPTIAKMADTLTQLELQIARQQQTSPQKAP
jgi:hypothetical protein